MADRKIILKKRLLLFLTLGLWMVLQGCDSGDAASGREKMKINSDPVSGAAKPPIDLAAPPRVESATFALG